MIAITPSMLAIPGYTFVKCEDVLNCRPKSHRSNGLDGLGHVTVFRPVHFGSVMTGGSCRDILGRGMLF